jgi:hypothetical protein
MRDVEKVCFANDLLSTERDEFNAYEAPLPRADATHSGVEKSAAKEGLPDGADAPGRPDGLPPDMSGDSEADSAPGRRGVPFDLWLD